MTAAPAAPLVGIVLVSHSAAVASAVAGLATGLSLIHGLLERYWDGIHPVLETDRDGDPTERLNAMAPLVDPEVILKDLRDTYLVSSREQGILMLQKNQQGARHVNTPYAQDILRVN